MKVGDKIIFVDAQCPVEYVSSDKRVIVKWEGILALAEKCAVNMGDCPCGQWYAALTPATAEENAFIKANMPSDSVTVTKE